MISTIKVFFLDGPCGKKDGYLPVNELKFEKDLVGTDAFKDEDILQHVYEVKCSIQRLYTNSYCDYFRLVYKLNNNIVSEEFNSTKELKKFEFVTEEDFTKHNLSKSDFKEYKKKNDIFEASKENVKAENKVTKKSDKVDNYKINTKIEDKKPKKSDKTNKTDIKTDIIKSENKENNIDSQYKGLDINILKKKKASLQSKMSRLKKEGQSVDDIKKEIDSINNVISLISFNII